MNKKLTELVSKIFKQIVEYNNLKGFRQKQQLGMPATDADIQKIQDKFSVDLPSDYREFLLAHDGWRQFEGQLDLLSTKQMCDQALQENLADVRELAQETGNVAVAKGFIIQACATSSDIVYLDIMNKAQGNNLDVVRWHYEEIDRYPNFMAYLEDCSDVLEDLLTDERERLR